MGATFHANARPAAAMRRPAAFRRPAAAAVAPPPSRHAGAAEWETLGAPSQWGGGGSWAGPLGRGRGSLIEMKGFWKV